MGRDNYRQSYWRIDFLLGGQLYFQIKNAINTVGSQRKYKLFRLRKNCKRIQNYANIKLQSTWRQDTRIQMRRMLREKNRSLETFGSENIVNKKQQKREDSPSFFVYFCIFSLISSSISALMILFISPSKIAGKLLQFCLMRWSVTRSCGKL